MVFIQTYIFVNGLTRILLTDVKLWIKDSCVLESKETNYCCTCRKQLNCLKISLYWTIMCYILIKHDFCAKMYLNVLQKKIFINVSLNYFIVIWIQKSAFIPSIYFMNSYCIFIFYVWKIFFGSCVNCSKHKQCFYTFLKLFLKFW